MPFEDLEVDFTEVKPCRGYRYLLVLVCTYSGWVEAYRTHTEKALLREVTPRYGLPLSIGSDNGPAFVAEIVQSLAKILKIKWKLHTAYRPQSSGKVECMNRTLKITLAKLCQETQSPWVDVLPLALLRARCTPRPSGYSPFEILYGRPPPIINRLRGDLRQIGSLDMSQHLQALGTTLRHISREVLERAPIPMGNWAHPHQPGDMVWVKDWKKEPLQPSWTGPHLVILATPTAVKVTGLTSWIHHSG
jgi:transposase InsO family protein